MHLGLQDKVARGNLESKRDWGYAPDYIEAMWLMLQHDTPDDYVVATGESHTIRDFLSSAFKAIGVDDWRPYVTQDPKYMRPAEVDVLCGDYSKTERVLGWTPKTSFEELVYRMVANDIKLVTEEMREND